MSIEIMSPVGSYESLMAAIQAGAGSVYFGVGKMNMRSRSAANFDYDDLQQLTQICKEHQVRSYLTVNTIVYNDEVEEMKKLVDLAKKCEVSAIIASDWAVIQYCRKIGMEVHISTQCNITNIEAVRFYAQFADVLVLAREVSLAQAADICQTIREENICGPSGQLIQIEMFVHGASVWQCLASATSALTTWAIPPTVGHACNYAAANTPSKTQNLTWNWKWMANISCRQKTCAPSVFWTKS